MLQNQPTTRKAVRTRNRAVPTPNKELYSHEMLQNQPTTRTVPTPIKELYSHDAPKPADHEEGCQKLE
jgi:hypothetical protein